MFTGEVRNQIDRIWDAVWSGGMSTPDEAYDAVANQVFPYIREMGGDDSTFGQHMKNARLTIPSPGLFAKVIDMLDEVPMDDLDTKGDVYKYLLSEISTSGKNGQFRTLRIPLPPMDIQARLGGQLEPRTRLALLHQQRAAQLDALCVALQHRAFAGEL